MTTSKHHYQPSTGALNALRSELSNRGAIGVSMTLEPGTTSRAMVADSLVRLGHAYLDGRCTSLTRIDTEVN